MVRVVVIVVITGNEINLPLRSMTFGILSILRNFLKLCGLCNNPNNLGLNSNWYLNKHFQPIVEKAGIKPIHVCSNKPNPSSAKVLRTFKSSKNFFYSRKFRRFYDLVHETHKVELMFIEK